ncbi:MAG: hypothetical protein Ct9H90mP10_08890 [Actinomycetota bacterium]|nr:MAG: hypothetical protein Ct9H90mP10_08890 [Actinomycetota bacterium]
MISFYRYSSCPFCHLRINEIISKKSEFGENFVPIAIFDCDFDDLVKNSKKHDGKSQFYVMMIVYILISLKFKTVSSDF